MVPPIRVLCPAPLLVAVLGLGFSGCVPDPEPDRPTGAHDAAPSPSDDASEPRLDAPSAPGCTGSSALFCEDFEALALGPAASSARWNVETAGGALTIDDTRARGANALRVTTQGNGHAFVRIPIVPPGNSMFGRMYLYVTAFPSAPDYAHYTLVEAAGNGGGGVLRPIGGQYIPPPAAGAALWGTGSDGGATGDWTSWRTTTPSEAGRWLCLEYELAAADSRMSVWIDGVAKPELTVTRTDHGGNQVDFVFPAITSVFFGWWLYQGGSTPSQFELWIDDIVLSTTRIGC